MKLPGCILMILTFAVLAFFFMYIPDIRSLRTAKIKEKNNTAKDLLLCGIITIAYAVTAFLNLGTLSGPESFVSFKVGESVTLKLEKPAEIDRVLAEITEKLGGVQP